MSEEISNINPDRSAFLILDYENGIANSVPDAQKLFATVQNNLALAREKKFTIAYVRVAFTAEQWHKIPSTNKFFSKVAREKAFHVDDESSQIIDQLKPHSGDIVVTKTRVGSFSTTDLHEQLQQKNIDTLILSGISTSGVILSTIVEASDKDYRLFVLRDSIFDRHDQLAHQLVTTYFPTRAFVIDSIEFKKLVS